MSNGNHTPELIPENGAETGERIDLGAVRKRLAGLRGRQYWRSLEELAESPDFTDFLHHEFPRLASVWGDGVDRRQFLKLMGASMALAGLSACGRPPREEVIPFVHAPEKIVPGKPLYFASALSLGGYASAVLVESHMGRPTKIEGNPQHPASLGATDIFAQAEILTMYDPDRAQVVTNLGDIRPWGACVGAIATVAEAQRQAQGQGLRFLTGTITSPTLGDQLQTLLKELPGARWHQYEPVGRDQSFNGTRAYFGRPLDVHYRLDKADVILSLDSDLLGCAPGSLRHVREFAARRRVQDTGAKMNRLYAVECTPSNTGASADHRLALRASEVETLARAVAAGLGVAAAPPSSLEEHAAWIKAVARDLQQHRGSSLVVAGEHQPAVVHALAHAINQTLGNAGNTVVYTEPVAVAPVEQMASLKELADDMEAGRVEVLVIIGVNPVYTAPADLEFAKKMARVGQIFHLGLYQDETSALSHWNIPEAHALESWSDARACDGTVTIVQPLIAPLYDGKTAHEVLAAFTAHPDLSAYEIVRGHWQRRHGGGDFEAFWRKALHDGVVPGTAAAPVAVAPKAGWQSALAPATAPPGEPGLELVFRADPSVYDGRFANNAWLQELPKVMTKLTWDNAALISPQTAERLHLQSEDVVELQYQGRKLRAPVWIDPGHAVDAVTVHLGYGRERAGTVGTGTGFNAYALRTSAAPWFGRGLQLRKTGDRYPLSRTQHHHSMEGRGLIRQGTLEEYRKNPGYVHEGFEEPHESLYPPYAYTGYAWGMVIDLNSCVGCNACVVACQAENNIPTVGKTEVSRGHEMHWIRIDRYYQGDLDQPEILFEPVPCMQCENAPCELVCPVEATVHSSEGLNDMVYNRCVGTRYCSNNCPYKVRRFNFLQYSDWSTESLKLMRNPDVTVRSRGVMEKCTYCVQRISAARIQAEKEDRRVRDGDMQTACQAVCPAEAIVFGDINDPDSRVRKLKELPRNYALLAPLNTRPRTTYLGSLRNPNPEIERT